MQTRLLACAAGGLAGLALASLVNRDLGLPPTMALAGCGLVGVGVGYFVSVLLDVFSANPGDHNPTPRD